MILLQNKQFNLLPPEPSNNNLELFLLQVLSTSSEDLFFLISFLSVNLSWHFAWTTDPSLATMSEPRSSLALFIPSAPKKISIITGGRVHVRTHTHACMHACMHAYIYIYIYIPLGADIFMKYT